jgi:hypothetical protein
MDRVEIRRWLTATLLAAALCSGCDNTPVTPDKGRHDWYPWIDTGPRADLWVTPSRDTHPDTQPPDLSSGDSAPSCPAPTGANCTTACGSGDLCTAAKGGTCAQRTVLSGAVTDKAVLVALTEAIVLCWNKFNGGKSVLCNALDTCGMQIALAQSVLDDFVCKKAVVTDFSSSSMYSGNEGAYSIFNCAQTPIIGVYRIDWKMNPIAATQKGSTCLAFHKYTLGPQDRVDVIDCKSASF